MRYFSARFTRALAFAFVGMVCMHVSAHASDYSPLVGIGSTDYKTKYAPTNPNFIVDSGVVTTGARLGETSILQWRIFIPPGTKQLTMALWAYTGAQDIKGSMKLNALPTVQASAITADTIVPVQTNNTLQQLIDGREVIFYANGIGGGVNIVTPAANPVLVTEGGWLYLNILQLPGMRTQTLQAVIATDEACYRNWFSNAQFDSMGNPVEGVRHTCTGTSGTPNPGTGTSPSPTPTPTPINGALTFTPATLFKDATTPVTISGVPAGVQCVAMNKFGDSYSAYATVNANNTILPLPTGVAGITESKIAKIVCGNAASNLSIVLTADGSSGTTPTPPNPTPPNPTPTPVGTVESTASDGTLTLSIPIAPTVTTDLTKAAKVFVAARFSMMGNTYLSFSTASGWKDPVIPNPDLYGFSDITSLASTQNITVPTGVAKNTLNQYGVEIFVGYKTTNGTTITNLGKVWP